SKIEMQSPASKDTSSSLTAKIRIIVEKEFPNKKASLRLKRNPLHPRTPPLPQSAKIRIS
ncbi:hypothetical protein MKX03_029561, partial [Papaver bracteatum]